MKQKTTRKASVSSKGKAPRKAGRGKTRIAKPKRAGAKRAPRAARTAEKLGL